MRFPVPTRLPDRAAIARALRRRRNQVWLAVFALLVATRIALPYVLRPIIVDQADKALIGRIALRDLDLSLIRGGVTLHGFEVYTDELPPPGSNAEPKPPLFAAERLWTQISWLALLWKTIDVEEFELEDFTVRLDRLKDGLVLPKPAPSPEPAPPPPEPAAKPAEGSGWGFAADSVLLRRGQIHFSDYTVGEEPQRFDLAIPNLGAQRISLRFDPSGRAPGHVAIEADIGTGHIGYQGDVETKRAGPAVHSKITLANLPIRGVRVYLKMFGWSALEGTLDAEIDHRFETAGANEVAGNVSLSNVEVRVPKLDRPALSFAKLSVALEKLDVVGQHASVSDVTLAGARLVVDPRSKRPLLVLEPPAARAAQPEEAQPPAPPAAPARPWTWRLARARLSGAEVDLLGAAEPLPIGVDSEVRDLASPTAGTSPVSLAVREGDGALRVDGALTLEPLGFQGKVVLDRLPLAPLAARAPAPGADLLRGGSARAELEVNLAPAHAPGSADLRVAGTLGLAGLDVGQPGSKDFSAQWKDLAIQLRELTLVPALGGDPARPRAIALDLQSVQLVEPAVVLTRTEKGLLLPAVAAPPAAEPENAQPAPAAAAPAPAPAAPPAQVTVKLDKLKVERGRARIADRTVKPFYDGRVERLDAGAGNLRWPPLRVDPFVVDLKGLHGAVLHVHGGIAPAGSRVRAELDGLPLAPFNPYVTQSGFSLANGALALKSSAHLEGESYDSNTDVTIHDLEVGGAQGEALFEQNFGIPLSMAIGLLKDTTGAITLRVPVAGDRAGARVGLGSLVGQALRKALVGALASPLKLLGIATSGGKVESLRPEPVEFLPGSAEPSPAGEERIEKIAGLLAAAPGISLTLHGGTSASDERALRERALLAELERTSGLRALGSLGQIGVRRAVRIYLAARAAGETPKELSPDESAWLEAKVAEQPLAPGALEELGDKRAALLAERLGSAHGLGEGRVSIGPPAAPGSMAVPGVGIALGTRVSAAE